MNNPKEEKAFGIKFIVVAILAAIGGVFVAIWDKLTGRPN